MSFFGSKPYSSEFFSSSNSVVVVCPAEITNGVDISKVDQHQKESRSPVTTPPSLLRADTPTGAMTSLPADTP